MGTMWGAQRLSVGDRDERGNLQTVEKLMSKQNPEGVSG